MGTILALPHTSPKDRSILEAFAKLDLADARLIITFVSSPVARFSRWVVKEVYTGSDHDAIQVELGA